MKSVLDSRQLLAASVLARTGSFTLAGQQLSLTQSAVSHAIKSLEGEVNCQLFIRTGRGVIVTEVGKYFIQSAEKILDEMETARTLVTPRMTRGKERLRLGLSCQAKEHILPAVLPLFQKEFSPFLLTPEVADFGRSLDLLESDLLDLVFCVKPARRPEFGYTHLFEDELRLIVGVGHGWARKGRISREEITNATLLHLKINNTPELLAEHLRIERITPRQVVEIADSDVIKQLAKTNQAVGVLPPWVVAKELADGSLISLPIGERLLVRQWGLAFSLKRQLAAIDRRFIELCQGVVPGILNKLQGTAMGSREQKESFAVVYSGAPQKLASLAFFLTSACGFWSELIA